MSSTIVSRARLETAQDSLLRAWAKDPYATRDVAIAVRTLGGLAYRLEIALRRALEFSLGSTGSKGVSRTFICGWHGSSHFGVSLKGRSKGGLYATHRVRSSGLMLRQKFVRQERNDWQMLLSRWFFLFARHTRVWPVDSGNCGTEQSLFYFLSLFTFGVTLKGGLRPRPENP